ncbi:MAG: cyclic nucleotide-binding domain-containing protein [Alphaproteobacteria bacterium]|nr:cyclic nucleotide-binding domain-containing protein [Alphaproteobacteria bacterium]
MSAARRRAAANTQHGVLFDVRKVPAGEVVFKEGDIALHMFLVEDGQVEISRTTKAGHRRVLGVVTRGGIFGETALVEQGPRQATARTLEPSTLRVITNDLFQEKFERLDPFMKAVIRLMARNVHSLSDKLVEADENYQDQIIKSIF